MPFLIVSECYINQNSLGNGNGSGLGTQEHHHPCVCDSPKAAQSHGIQQTMINIAHLNFQSSTALSWLPKYIQQHVKAFFLRTLIATC